MQIDLDPNSKINDQSATDPPGNASPTGSTENDTSISPLSRLSAGQGTPEPAAQESAQIEQVLERFLAEYPGEEEAVAERIRSWLSPTTPLLDLGATLRTLESMTPTEMYDQFWQDLPFGTAGRRGPVGVGPNRINPTTVAIAIQGHADYLRISYPDRPITVVIANDVRVFLDIAERYRPGSVEQLLGLSSWRLARIAAEIYAGNGIKAYLAALNDEAEEAVLTTPELSFAIRSLGAQGGVNFSASHNHPDDNGAKFYDASGAQPVPPEDQRLMEAMQASDDPRSLPLSEAVSAALVQPLPLPVREEYFGLYSEQRSREIDGPEIEAKRRLDRVKIVFTPLSGSGSDTVADLLRREGADVLIPPGQEADGSFAAIPFRTPNPEVAQATAPAREFAEANGAAIVFSADPDADRIGVDVRESDGSWRHLTGNQIATILAFYLTLDISGPEQSGFMLTTAVTSKLLAQIGADAGVVVVDDLLVGFKTIAEELRQIELKTPRPALSRFSLADFVFGAEESHGFSTTAALRDKDAASVVLPLAELYQRLASQGQTLFDYYLSLLERYGGYAESARSAIMAGEIGVRKIAEIVDSFRATPPVALAASGKLLELIDWQDEERFGPLVSETDRISRNMIQLRYKRATVTLRPSGTEPKLKWYVQLLPDSTIAEGAYRESRSGQEIFAEASEQAAAIADAVYRDILSRVELSLTEAALLLPDIISVEEKLGFDEKIVPWLLDALRLEEFSELDLLAGLREHSQGLTPGADPLPALTAPLSLLATALPAREQARLESLLRAAE